MRLSPTRLATSTVALGALSLAAAATPAGASTSPSKTVTQAIAATESATSLQVSVSEVQSKQRVTFSVQATNSGVGQGSISMGKETATIRAVGGTVYLMANAAFWQAEGGKSAEQLLVGKWVSTSATSQTGSQLAPLLNSSSLLKQLFSSSGLSTSAFKNAGTGKVGGQPVTVIAGTGKLPSSGGGKIYIASSGSPYVLKIVYRGKGGSGTVTLSKYNQPVNPAVPSNPVDLDTLSGGS
jgi:hypothetical protein